MTRNLPFKLAILILCVNILTACAGLTTTQTKSPLRVEFTQSWGNYTLIYAQDQGLFEKYGVQVEPVYYDGLSDVYSDLAAGQIDGALIAVGDTINVNRNAPMKVVAVLDDGGRNSIVVGPDINSIQDLKGKTIGMIIGSQYEITVVEMLESAGMSLSDVNIVVLDPKDAVSALTSGQVQAAFTWDPFLSDALSSGYKIIYPQEKRYLFPNLIVFQKSIVDERPEDVRAFLKAWFQALEIRMQREGQTRDLAAKYLGLSPDVIRPDDKLKLYTSDENKTLFDIQQPNSIYSITKITSDYLISSGVVAEEIDPLELLDPAYLP